MASGLRIYNTLTRNIEPLSLREPGEATIYCCGPTVYDAPHAGHARAALAPDLLVRRLTHQGVKVTFVRNITDVDDKILERSKKNGESPLALSQRMAAVYQEEMKTCGCLPPTHEPRVSESVPEIIELIQKLVGNESAYVLDMGNGKQDVYFAVRSFPGYGKLSRRKIDDLQAGARVERDEHKRDPLDFALWKGAGPEEWAWDSPWGRGRPGWHIECSAMAEKFLRHGFDVHGGGMDLIFPHHENEIAQSEAASPGQGDYVRCWMHNGFVNVDKEKMSKSLGNFVTVRDVLARNDAEGFRWFLLAAHYRGPIQFDTEQLPNGRVVFPGVDEAERRVDYLFATVERLTELTAAGPAAPAKMPPELQKLKTELEAAAKQGDAALDDDLNTPIALASLGEMMRIGNETVMLAQKRKKDASFVGAAGALGRSVADALSALTQQLGLLNVSPREYAARVKERRLTLRQLSAKSIEQKLSERVEARKSKDFARGDAIRDELLALGVAISDGVDGSSSWTITQ
ncbi:MAG: Cysteinyl-tRNA synthetase [Polyangiaceae bacterium]|jgi:cysteinyl-tRNA synthetase|nr:Cysteinyl-tRNA synthetase [Polyangiaceae bacterium]